MRNTIIIKSIFASLFSIGLLLSSTAAEPKATEEEVFTASPKGVAPLVGVAMALPREESDSMTYLQIHIPKVVWEISGTKHIRKDIPESEWFKVATDNEMIILDLKVSYSLHTPLSERGQNRVVDLNGKRLSLKEVHSRLAAKTPVLVSASGLMPDPFYLQCAKKDTLVILFGMPDKQHFNLLPTKK